MGILRRIIYLGMKSSCLDTLSLICMNSNKRSQVDSWIYESESINVGFFGFYMDFHMLKVDEQLAGERRDVFGLSPVKWQHLEVRQKRRIQDRSLSRSSQRGRRKSVMLQNSQNQRRRVC